MSRNDQIASVLHRAIQTVISGGLADPRVKGLISVTEVNVGPDLRNATVKVSVLPEAGASTVIHGLNHAAKHVRSRVAERVDIRRMPQLVFKHDPSLRKQADVHAAINESISELGTEPGEAPEAPEDLDT